MKPAATPCGVISLLTDFGVVDPFVGVMKGVIARIHRPALVIDITHDIAPQDIASGAFVLAKSYRYFPRGTVHVAVVDPGVGTSRKPIVVEYDGHYFVGPNNGLLSLAAPRGRSMHLDRREWFLSPMSTTFHGRDVFAPVAARLAAGLAWRELGSPLPPSKRVRLRMSPVRVGRRSIRGCVVSTDRFGNLITNIEPRHLGIEPRHPDVEPRHPSVPASRAAARPLRVRIAGRWVEGIRASYGRVAEGELVAVFGGYGLLEIAVRNGSARAALQVRPGEPVFVETSPRRARGAPNDATE